MGRAWVEQSGGELLVGSVGSTTTLLSGCYCRRTYHLAWLWKSPQGRVNSCEVCRIVKQVIGHILETWKDNAEHPLPPLDLVALCERVTNQHWLSQRHKSTAGAEVASFCDPYLAYPP